MKENEKYAEPGAYALISDLYWASCLACLLKIWPELVRQDKIVYFAFEKSDEFRNACEKYRMNTPLPSRDLCDTIKRLRSELILMIKTK